MNYSLESGATALRDGDYNALSNAEITTGDDYHFVLSRATEEFVTVALADSLDENFVFFPDAAAVCFGRKLILQGNDFIQATYLHRFGHIIRQMLTGIGAGALAVFEHESTVVAALTHERKALLMVLFCLAAITDKNIG